MSARIRLENLRKRLRERVKARGVDQGVSELIHEIESVTNDLLDMAPRGEDTLQNLTTERRYYERLANDGENHE